MKNLYIMGKKFYSYYKPKPVFHSKFTKFYAVNEEEYRKKKLESLNEFLKDTNDPDIGRRTEMLYTSVIFAKKSSGLDNAELAKKLSISKRTVYAALTWGKKKGLVDD